MERSDLRWRDAAELERVLKTEMPDSPGMRDEIVAMADRLYDQCQEERGKTAFKDET